MHIIMRLNWMWYQGYFYKLIINLTMRPMKMVRLVIRLDIKVNKLTNKERAIYSIMDGR